MADGRCVAACVTTSPPCQPWYRCRPTAYRTARHHRPILPSEILNSNAVTCDLYDARVRVAYALRVLGRSCACQPRLRLPARLLAIARATASPLWSVQEQGEQPSTLH